MPPRPTWLNNKLLLIKRPTAAQRLGERRSPETKKQRLRASRQKSRRLKIGFATFNRARSSFRSWRRASLGYGARVTKGIGLEPDCWPAVTVGDAVTHSVDALDPLCKRTLRLAS